MWSRRRRPQVGHHHPQGTPENSSLDNQYHVSPQDSRVPVAVERYDSQGYEQHRHVDSPYARNNRAFTDLGYSLNDRQACHPDWHSSHAISGIKRKRILSRNRQALDNLPNTILTPQNRDSMHNTRQRRNGDYRKVQDHRQPGSDAFRWRDNSLLPGNVVVHHDQQQALNYHPMPFLNFHAANCPSGNGVNEQSGRYHYNASTQPSSFSSSSDTSSSRQGVSPASIPNVSVKDDPEREWLELKNGQNEASFEKVPGLGYAAPFLAAPTVVDVPTNDGDKGNPLQHDLPPWDFSSDLPSFPLDGNIFSCANQDLNWSNDLDFAVMDSAESNDFKTRLTDSFEPFDDSSSGFHGLTVAGQVSLAYPTLDSELALEKTQNLPKMFDDAAYKEFKFDPPLPDWDFNANDENNDLIFNAAPSMALNLWGQSDEAYNPSCSTSNSSSSQPTPASSTSKRYSRDRALGYRGRDDQKDQLLVQWKQEGLSYKEIKLRGGFEEAESTLRGRYRTLTKPKEARVRKPEWTEQDIHNLIRTVDHFARGGSAQQQPSPSTREEQLNQQQRYSRCAPSVRGRDVGKIPWKQVAVHMEGLGSYRFGNATVKKKYLEIAG